MSRAALRALWEMRAGLVEELDALFFRQLANEQDTVFFGYDVSVETLHHDFLFLCGVNNAVVGLEKTYVIANPGVSVYIVFHMLFQ